MRKNVQVLLINNFMTFTEYSFKKTLTNHLRDLVIISSQESNSNTNSHHPEGSSIFNIDILTHLQSICLPTDVLIYTSSMVYGQSILRQISSSRLQLPSAIGRLNINGASTRDAKATRVDSVVVCSRSRNQQASGIAKFLFGLEFLDNLV